MILTTPSFDKMLGKLPDDIRQITLAAITNPTAPNYRLKKLNKYRLLREQSWGLRVTNQFWRALAQKTSAGFEWYWIGTHEQYNRMVGQGS